MINNNDNNFNGLAWSMFAGSGRIGYYLLYRAMTGEDEQLPRSEDERFR